MILVIIYILLKYFYFSPRLKNTEVCTSISTYKFVHYYSFHPPLSALLYYIHIYIPLQPQNIVQQPRELGLCRLSFLVAYKSMTHSLIVAEAAQRLFVQRRLSRSKQQQKKQQFVRSVIQAADIRSKGPYYSITTVGSPNTG